MSSPFVFDVAEMLRPGADMMPEQRRNSGKSPSRIGPEMIAIPEGGDVVVEATLTPLGGGVLVDADVEATLDGQCVRCLAELHPRETIHISQVYSVTEEFNASDEDDESHEPLVVDDLIDIEQAVVDEAGLSLPFNPTCEGSCHNDETNVPSPDGVSGEDDEERVDPRWSGLEKFL